MSGSTMSDDQFEGPDETYVDTVKDLTQVLLHANAIFDSTEGESNEVKDTFETMCKCRPLALEAMLEAGVEVLEALGTARAACELVARWIDISQKRAQNLQLRPLNTSSAAWLQQRKLNGKKSLLILQKHFKGASWTGRVEEMNAMRRQDGERGEIEASSEIEEAPTQPENTSRRSSSRLTRLWPLRFIQRS